MTNADKIRAMTDEELAELIAWKQFSAANQIAGTLGINFTTSFNICQKYLLDWLKQEVKDNG